MSFGISESDVTDRIFREQALEFPREMSPTGFPASFGSRALLLLKTKTKENVNTNYQKWRQFLTTQEKRDVIFMEYIL